MRREQVLDIMAGTGVVAVIRARSSENLVDVGAALVEGGVRCLEITMTTPDALNVIARARAALADKAVVGVGSVLDADTARAAILAGAQFVVGPVLNLEMIQTCRRYAVACIPGAFTPTEILTAWQAGADVVKVFPATKLGPEYFKDVLGPMPQLRLTPTGGVSEQTTPAFIAAGAVCVGAGSALVSPQAMAAGDFSAISAKARAFIAAVQQGHAT